MAVRDWLRPPHQVLATFLAVAALSTAALGWLSWRVLDQDRQLEAQRQRLELEQAADGAVAAMQQTFAALVALAARQPDDTAALPAGVSWAAVHESGRTTLRPAGLPYVPVLPERIQAADAVFAEGQVAEFTPGADRDTALRSYTGLASSPNTAVRAGALARIARVHLSRRNTDAALQVYSSLSKIGDDVGALGYAPSLVAALGSVTALAQSGRAAELQTAAAALSLDLARGRWPLLEAEYLAHRASVRELLPNEPPAPPDPLAAAESLAWLWDNRMTWPGSSSRLVATSAGPVLAIWQKSADNMRVLLAGPSFVRTLCASGSRDGFQCALTDLDGLPIAGGSPQGVTETRAGSVSKLPWTVQTFRDPARRLDPSPSRLPLLSMFAALGAVLAAGWYFIIRSIAREVRVARLQTDFVAAVSHEFRSPLTSLSHIAEMLVEDRIPSAELRQQSYGVLVRDTDRLRRLVETLLDLGRFEAGAATFRKESSGLSRVVTETVTEFQQRVRADGYTIRLDVCADELLVDADVEALSRALWNLLDNAKKYSPDTRMIYVDVTREENRAVIAVRDEGLGIPAHERAEIFQRFVRGAESRSRQIKGTGIGLALVREIVRGHGGEIELASEVGRGSTFRMILPLSCRTPERAASALQPTRP